MSNDLTQIADFPTWIPVWDSHSPAYLDLFISSDPKLGASGAASKFFLVC